MLKAYLAFILLASAAIALTDATCPKTCAANAECIAGVCECKSRYVWGEADFQCKRKSEVAAEQKTDPELTNFSNETIPFFYPCRHLVVDVVTKLIVNKEVEGSCHTVGYTFTARVDGKLFEHGMDVAIKITLNNGTQISVSTRTYGAACNGVDSYTFQAKNGVFYPNGPWVFDDANYNNDGITIVHGLDTRDYAQLVARQCGFRAHLIAYDVCQKVHQTRVPGVAFIVRCSHHPEWQSIATVTGLPPDFMTATDTTFTGVQLGGLTESETMLVRAYEQGTVQNQPWPSNECTGNPFDVCPTLVLKDKALDICSLILSVEKFVKCRCGTGTSGANCQALYFKRCVHAVCTHDAAECNALKAEIPGTCDFSDLPVVTSFLNHMCPF